MTVTLTKSGLTMGSATSAEDMELAMMEALNGMQPTTKEQWAQRRALLCFVPSLCRYMAEERKLGTDPQDIGLGAIGACANILINVSAHVIGHDCPQCHGLTLTAMTNTMLNTISSTLDALAASAGPADGEHVH